MNAGFGSLTYLKSQLLAEALRGKTQYDAALTLLGTGVVGAFEAACQRPFARVEDDTEILPADRAEFLLSRLPLEEITTIELKLSEADGWVEQTINDFVRTIDLANGIVHLPSEAGPHYGQVRFTYTGGYFWNTNEEGEDALPEGATALPAALKHAWILQCKKVWEVSDPIGAKIVPSKESVQLVGLSLAGLELVPEVKRILADFERYNLT